jgi:transcriptional regulator GlxA family with amidase domain
MTSTVAIYIFRDVEVLDFAGPYEVFTTASRVHRRRHPQAEEPFRVVTVAKSASPVRARAGLRVLPDCTLRDCPPTDILLVPGGVVEAELADPDLLAWIRDRAAAAKLAASVCTGSFILAKAGLLAGRSATTHWEDIADLRSRFGEVDVREGVRWVDEDRIVSSAGIAAGIDMSLHLVARFAGPELAQATARQMDVPYRDDPAV